LFCDVAHIFFVHFSVCCVLVCYCRSSTRSTTLRGIASWVATSVRM
jgi:hypothetical protein